MASTMPAPPLHILLIEDNDSLREATLEFLNDNGHHATGVASAEEVDETPTRDVPDLYLVDVNLPGENGFALTQRIRKSQPLAGIVLMTARSQLRDRLDGYDCGADNYLIKPVEQAELLACIHSLAMRLKSSPALVAHGFGAAQPIVQPVRPQRRYRIDARRGPVAGGVLPCCRAQVGALASDAVGR